MKIKSVRFERDPSLDGVEVLIRAPERDAAVDELIERQGSPGEPIAVFDGEGAVRRLRGEDILSASTEGRLVCIVTRDGTWYTRQSLQSLESAMGGRLLRISRYELVNLEAVRRYEFTPAGTLRLEFSDGRETWASRRCIPAIRKRLKGGE